MNDCKSYYKYLNKFAEDKYTSNVYVKTKEELVEKMLKKLKEDKYEFEEDEESYGNKYEQVKSMIDNYTWLGEGEYCLDNNDLCIVNTKQALEGCLDYINFNYPIQIEIDILEDSKKFMQKYKKQEGFKYIYLVIHIEGIAQFRITHIVKTNKKLDDVIYDLAEKDIIVGDYNSLGANYSYIELEEFDVDFLLKSLHNEEGIYYDVIEI